MRRSSWIAAGLVAVAAIAGAGFLALRRGDGEAAAATSTELVALQVAGRPLAVPANMLRFADQRRPGPKPRLDLALTWPELEGRSDETAARFDTPEAAPDILYLTIEPRRDGFDSASRLAAVYSRFFVGEPWTGPGGLQGRRMAPKSGYEDEEIYLEPGAVHPFVARCFPLTPGKPPSMCLEDRNHGALSVSLRFPIGLLADWRAVDAALESRLAGFGVEIR